MDKCKLKSNLWKVMHERGIRTTSHLMRVCGVSRGTINKLYTGDGLDSIRLRTLIKVCGGLDCSLNDLVEYNKLSTNNE